MNNVVSKRGPPTETLKDCKEDQGFWKNKTKELPRERNCRRSLRFFLFFFNSAELRFALFYTNILLSTSTKGVWMCVGALRQETTTDECV